MCWCVLKMMNPYKMVHFYYDGHVNQWPRLHANEVILEIDGVQQETSAGAWKGAIWRGYQKSLQNRELRSYPQVSKHILVRMT